MRRGARDTPKSRDARWLEPVSWDTRRYRARTFHSVPCADTPRVLPCRLGLRVRPQDGPLRHLWKVRAHRDPGHHVAVNASSRRASLAATCVTVRSGTSARCTLSAITAVTVQVNTSSRRTSRDPCVSAGNAAGGGRVAVTDADREPNVATSDDELFPICAECGTKPDCFVPELAAKYAEYLRSRTPE